MAESLARRHDLHDHSRSPTRSPARCESSATSPSRCSRHGAPRATSSRRSSALTAASAPAGVDLLFASDKHAIERLVRAYEPDLLTCWGFPWKIPQAALDVPRLGSINLHPALLPRHRGPIPLAWALRDGDAEWGSTWHRMDAELDTGNVLVADDGPDRGRRRRHRGVRAAAPRRRRRDAAARARACRGRRPGRPAAGRGRQLGGALHRRRLRPRRLVADRSRDPQPGARVAPHVRHVWLCARRSPSSTASRSCCSRRA